jgi:hypothetical protein
MLASNLKSDYANFSQKAGIVEIDQSLLGLLSFDETVLVAFPYFLGLMACNVESRYTDYVELAGYYTGSIYRANFGQCRFFVKATLKASLVVRYAERVKESDNYLDHNSRHDDRPYNPWLAGESQC